MSDLPAVNLEVRLVRKPEALPTGDDFEIVRTPMAAPGGDEALVRNLCFLVSASLREMIAKGAKPIKGIPYPPLEVGDTLRGQALGEVVHAPSDSGLSRGDLVLHFRGWRDYSLVPVAQCGKVEDNLPDRAAHLGHGWTAYAALTRGLTVHPGDTVFVSSGGGAIGSMAGQIARALGAGRVIGSTSSREKADRLVSELAYDAAVYRGERSMADRLAEAAPEGLDVVVDNVGGEQLQAAVGAAREGARVVILGTLSSQLAPASAAHGSPVELDSAQILMRRVSIRGYSADDDPAAQAEWSERFGKWLRDGTIRFPHQTVTGLAQAPRALERTIRGEFLGAVIVKLD